MPNRQYFEDLTKKDIFIFSSVRKQGRNAYVL